MHSAEPKIEYRGVCLGGGRGKIIIPSGLSEGGLN